MSRVIGKIQVAIAADTSPLIDSLDTAERVVSAFAENTKSQIQKLEKNFKNIALAAGVKEGTEEYKKLYAVFQDNTALLAAERALKKLGDTGVLTAKQVSELAQKMNFKNSIGSSAANALGFRTQKQVAAEIKSLGDSYRFLKTSGVASAKEIEVAQSQLKAKVKELAKEYKNVIPPKSAKEVFDKDTNAADMLTNKVKTLVAAYASFQTVKDIAQTSIKIDSLEKSFYAITGSMGGARGEMAYVREEAQRLGLDFMALADSYKGFSAAAKFADMDAVSTKEIFTSISEASTVLGLSGEKTRLVLMALEQMISKGKVSMEELRRQLGDSLPGAFELGAKAMGMNLQEFNKLVSTGNLMTDEFLPKFAATIKETFGPGLEEAIKTPRAELQRLSNEFVFAQEHIGKAGFLAGIGEGARQLHESLKSDDIRNTLTETGKVLGNVASGFAQITAFALQHADAIKFLVQVYASYRLMGIAVNAVRAKMIAADVAEITQASSRSVVMNKLTADIMAQTRAYMALSASQKFAAAGTAVSGLATRGLGALGAMIGGPGLAVIGIFAAIEAISHFSTKMSESEKLAAKYGVSLSGLQKEFAATALAIDSVSQEIGNVSIAYQEAQEKIRAAKSAEVGKLLSEMHNIGDFQDFYTDSWGETITLDLVQSAEGEKVKSALKEIIQDIQAGSYDADEFKARIASLGIEIQKLKEGRGYFSDESADAELLADRLGKLIVLFDAFINKSKELAATDPMAATLRGVEKKLHEVKQITDKLDKTDAGEIVKSFEGQRKKLEEALAARGRNEFGYEFLDEKYLSKKIKQLDEEIKKAQQKGNKSATSADIAENRTANSAEQAYLKARDAANQLELKNEELYAQLSGGKNIGVAEQKAANEYEKQVDAINRDNEKLLGDAEIWRKQGRLTPEVQEFINLTLQENEKRKEQLAIIKETTIAIAQQEELKRNLSDASEYHKITGALKNQLQAEIDLLNVELERKQSAERRALLEEKIRQLTAERDLDPAGMLRTGMQNLSTAAGQGYIDFWEKGLPNAFESTTDAFGSMMTDIAWGTTSAGDAWAQFGQTVQKTIMQMMADLTSLYLKMALFGNMSSSGSVGGIVGAIGGFIGDLFSGGLSSGWSNTNGPSLGLPVNNQWANYQAAYGAYHSGGIVGKDFPGFKNVPDFVFENAPRFHKGGYLAPGEVPIIAQTGERILSRAETAAYDRGIAAAFSSAMQPVIQINPVVVNNTGKDVQAETEVRPNGGGGFDIITTLTPMVDKELARMDAAGRSTFGNQLDRSRGLNRASATFR
ncbi:MAG: tape measure protein [Desulfovibrio sp.]|jgi:tape measure domain-containing protein|nr:tape measure protein [Desulfovibrio sp.]